MSSLPRNQEGYILVIVTIGLLLVMIVSATSVKLSQKTLEQGGRAYQDFLLERAAVSLDAPIGNGSAVVGTSSAFTSAMVNKRQKIYTINAATFMLIEGGDSTVVKEEKIVNWPVNGNNKAADCIAAGATEEVTTYPTTGEIRIDRYGNPYVYPALPAPLPSQIFSKCMISAGIPIKMSTRLLTGVVDQ